MIDSWGISESLFDRLTGPAHIPYSGYPKGPYFGYPKGPYSGYPKCPYSGYPEGPYSDYPEGPYSGYPESPYSVHPEVRICRQNLLTALVRWDDIYLNECIMHSGRTDALNFAVYRLHQMLGSPSFVHIVPMTSLKDERKYLSSELIRELYRHIKIIANDISDERERWLLLRGGLYVMQANNMGIAYLPHPFRAKVLNDSGIFKREFDGQIYLDIVDKEVRNYINAINELSQFELLSTSFPVLYEFISKIAKDPFDEFKVALDLREDKNVSLFRKSVNEISEELKKGNLHAVRASLMKVQEICTEITDSLYRKPLSYGVSLGLSPSIEISREHKPKVSSGFHTTFLSDLANFALKGTIPTYYMFEH